MIPRPFISQRKRNVNSPEEKRSEAASSLFRISDQPVAADKRGREIADENLGQLPRSYGRPIVFAIARDPKSLFVYWDIDWSAAFGNVAPHDRKVYLRLYDADSSEISRITIEPLANTCDVPVAQPRSSFRIEIGYFDPEQLWHSVGTSEIVSTPPDKIGKLAPGDFALVPFHITFQRMTELFRRSKSGGESLIQSLARLQEKALNSEERASLTPEEQEIFRAMKASISGNTQFPKRELGHAGEMWLQKKLEKILGFGASSPTSPFGGSSRSD
jgi:hypothetical protein